MSRKGVGKEKEENNGDEEREELEIGQRVRVKNEIDVFQVTIVEEGETGTVVEKFDDEDDALYRIELDTRHGGLDRWDNKFEIYRNQYPKPSEIEPIEED